MSPPEWFHIPQIALAQNGDQRWQGLVIDAVYILNPVGIGGRLKA